MIPRRLHCVWVGGPLPDEAARRLEGWRRHNPGWDLTVWNDGNIDFSIPFIARAYRRRRWAAVADAVRLWAVARHGGIYLDTDVEAVRPFEPQVRHRCFFGFQLREHPTDWVNTAVFGAEPDHWFVERALAALLRAGDDPLARLLGIERPTRYGPRLVTRLLREAGLDRYADEGVTVGGDVAVLPTDVFYPYSWEEEYTADCITPRTLAVHLWEQSWKKGGAAALAAPLLRATTALAVPFRRAVGGSR
jgi:hypothetical protein